MHKIFLVHGMGDWNKGWSASMQEAIKGYYNANKYKFLQPWPFDQQFEFVEINYNDICEEYLKQARDNAAELGKWSKLVSLADAEGVALLKRVVTAASAAPADSFLVTHLGDVAMFVATDIGELIKASV